MPFANIVKPVANIIMPFANIVKPVANIIMPFANIVKPVANIDSLATTIDIKTPIQ